MCDDNSCGKCMGIGELALVGTALSAGASAYGVNQTNNTNQAIAGTNTAANAFMQVQNQQYNAEEAKKNRDFNAEQADWGRDFANEQASRQRDWTAAMQEDTQLFNSTEAKRARDETNYFNMNEAQKNREFQLGMSNTQYQRAIGDMKAAGLNPMLAYKNGGAGMAPGATASGGGGTASSSTPSGAMASAGNASGSAASSGSWAGPGQWTAKDVYGPAASSAMAALELGKKLEMYDAQIKNVESDTAVNDSKVPQNVAQTRELDARADKTVQEIDNVLKQGHNIVADTTLKLKHQDLAEAQKHLVEMQTKREAGQVSIQELTKAQIKADTLLTQYKAAIEEPYAEKAKTDFGKGEAYGDAIRKWIPGVGRR